MTYTQALKRSLLDVTDALTRVPSYAIHTDSVRMIARYVTSPYGLYSMSLEQDVLSALGYSLKR